MMRKLVQLTNKLLSFIAFSNAAAACAWGGHQPKLPDQLKH